MAKDLTPDNWLASMSEDGTTINIPIASIAGLTAAEADVATGDIRKFLSKMLDTLIARYATIGAVPADLPTTLTMRKVSTASYVEYTVRIAGSITTFTPGADA